MTKRFIYSFYPPIILFDNDDDFKWIFECFELFLVLICICFVFLSSWACVFCLLFVFPIFSLSPLVSFSISIPCLAGFCALPPPSPPDSEWGSSSWTRCVRELRLGWGQPESGGSCLSPALLCLMLTTKMFPLTLPRVL